MIVTRLFYSLCLLLCLWSVLTVECQRRRRVASSVVYSWKNTDLSVAPEARPMDLVSSFFREVNLTMITAGKSHSAAVDPQGTVYTWGANGLGQLGDKTTVDGTVPTPIYFIEDGNPSSVVQLVSGHNHMMMLRSDGKLYAWGANNLGQLGDASTTIYSNIPVQVKMDGVLDGRVITQMAAGATHSLVLTSDGRIFAWGHNLKGNWGMEP